MDTDAQSMSFQERITWLVLAAMILVYGWYFVTVTVDLEANGANDVAYQGLMLATVIALVIVVAIGAGVIALSTEGGDENDERDRSISRYGEYIGGFVLTCGALLALGLAMAEANHFWIANAILLGLVLAEITAGLTKIVLYRRGMLPW